MAKGGNFEDLNQSLASLLECPVCYEYMRPPIWQCKTGHNICSDCKPKLQKCPTCREDFSNTRNYTLEQIAQKLSESTLYFCKYKKAGCKDKLKLTELAKHENFYCPFRDFECLIGKANGDCSWKGKRHEIARHVRQKHKDRCWMEEENEVEQTDFDFQDAYDVELISAHNKAFWFHFKVDCTKQLVLMAVQYIGHTEDAGDYMYEVEFTSKDDTRKVMYSRRTHKDLLNIASVFEHNDCFTITFASLKFFLKKKKLEYCVDIKEVDDD